MKNNTQYWILPTLLCSTMAVTPVMAAECYDPSPFSGFYIGAGLGGSFTSAKEHSRTDAFNNIVIPITPTLPLPGVGTNTFGHSLASGHRKNRIAAGVYGGYGYVCAQMYWGLEAFLNYTGYKTRTRRSLILQENLLAFEGQGILIPFFTNGLNLDDAIQTRIKLRRGEGGLDFRPGYFIAPCTLLYGRIGVGYNKISIRTNLNNNFTQTSIFTVTPPPLTITAADIADVERHKKVGSFRLGFGLEQNICENLTIRADYVNTNYRHVRHRRSFTFTNATGQTATFSDEIKISRFMNNTFTLGLSYYW